ncbi:cation:proton antiporter [Rhodomicrobium lacus]|uniref:cation:proton antiporter n=1 Tax=Rhodomicrobium lacus TaxID=2498452 RepID=UPI0026E32E9E|nr:sodium:proton antiporter [Rhodomicrobium lacus]WKW50598.1 sodium:proton antiporter [Rhodomicrobium lacus]
MDLFAFLVALLVGAVFLTRVAAKLSMPYPALLALGGAAVGLLPNIPRFELDSQFALLVFVAPALFIAACEVSPRDLKDNRLPIVTLVVAAVAVTTAAVAMVFHSLEPQVPWAAAIALGAIVSPPDAVAATAVLRQVRIPHRILQILEGESLFNDASALLIFSIAVRVATQGSDDIAPVAFAYVLSIFASVVAGLACVWLCVRLVAFVRDPASSIVLQFCAVLGVWMLAEKLDLSPVLTIVAFGIGLMRFAVPGTDTVIRVQSRWVWRTAIFFTNVLGFTLLGFQLGPLLSPLTPAERSHYFVVALIVLATVILVRLAWVLTFNTVLRSTYRAFPSRANRMFLRPSLRGSLVVGWSGMRGVLTLAAALALPAGFPERELIQFVAFVVVLGTLLAQGLTLASLVRILRLPNDNQVDAETAFARRKALEAGLQALEGETSAYADALRIEYNAALARWNDTGALLASGLPTMEASEHDLLHQRTVTASRQALAKLLTNGQIGTEAYFRVEEVLDRTELYTSRSVFRS